MFDHLEISNGRERTLVGVADAVLTAAAWPLSILRPPQRGAEPRRILLLRLERIGDLLMTLGAIRAVRLQAPDAVIDLVVGSWNASLAALVGGIDRIEVMDAPWLSRGSGGQSLARMARRTRGWRRQHYDLAINFEGDIRSHLLMAGSLARQRIGFDMAGGGPLLTRRVHHDPRRHTAENALALVESAFELSPGTIPRPDHPEGRPLWRVELTASLVTAARRRLAAGGIPERDARPLVAIHPAGGRAIKQWPAERFAAVARALAQSVDARVLLTGTDADRVLVEEVATALRPDVDVHVIAGDVDLPVLAAVLARCHLLVTGDTGPMHLAAAVDTPTVAVFGPSDPARYAPLTPRARVVRVDLPCSPCNRIRQPPARCVGHTPDCLNQVTVEMVVQAARDVLAAPGPVALRTP